MMLEATENEDPSLTARLFLTNPNYMTILQRQWRRQLWKSTSYWQGPENICQVLIGTKVKFKN